MSEDRVDFTSIRFEDLPEWWQKAISQHDRVLPEGKYTFVNGKDCVRMVYDPAVDFLAKNGMAAQMEQVYARILDGTGPEVTQRCREWLDNCFRWRINFDTGTKYGFWAVPVREGWIDGLRNRFDEQWTGRPNVQPYVYRVNRMHWRSHPNLPYPPTKPVIAKVLRWLSDQKPVGDVPTLTTLRDLLYQLDLTPPEHRFYAIDHMKSLLADWESGNGR